MTPKDNSGNAGRPLAVEVAIIGAGPVGLMTANLLGLAGIRVLVLERNAGLLGLPRAIAYDAETLRLFSQVGLFDDIAPGLIQDPHVRHVNARKVTLMAADFPRGLYGHSSLGTFYQPDFERVLLQGLARFPSVRAAFGHEATNLHSSLHRLRQSRTFHTLANGPKSGVQLTLSTTPSTCRAILPQPKRITCFALRRSTRGGWRSQRLTIS